MALTQTFTQTDIYTKIQEIVALRLPWANLTKAQKLLFSNPLLISSLGVSSNQEAFNLLSSQLEISTPLETGSTVDAALLSQLVEEMNQSQLETSLKTKLSLYTPDQQKLIEKLVDIRREEIQLEKLLKNKQALKDVKSEVDKLNLKQDPRLNLIKIANKVIPSSNKIATNKFVNICLTSKLDIFDPKDLGLAIGIALNGNDPIASTYREVSQAVVPATDQDYETDLTVDAEKLPPPNKIDAASITKSTQKIISKVTSINNDPSDISDPLIIEVKKLKEIENNSKAIEISHTLTTTISDTQIDQLTHTINQLDPKILQSSTLTGEQAAAIIEQFPNNTLSPQVVKLYDQGLKTETWTKIYQNPKTKQIISSKQSHLIRQQLRVLDNSKLGQEINKPLTGSARRFQTFVNKVSGKLPSRFTKPLKFILNPSKSIKGLIGKRAGKLMGRKIYKAFAKKVTNKTARLVAKTLLRQGLKQGSKALIKLGLRGALLAGEAAVSATGVGLIVVVAFEAVAFIGKKVIGGIQSIAKSIWGEKIKSRDLLAFPLAGLAGLSTLLAGLGAATVAAASSAAGTIAISAAAGIFLYITAFTVAPLISTIAQLEGQPGLEYSIAGPTGPIPPGCPSGWPTTGGVITQGPKTLSSHYATEAIDIGIGFGSSIYTTHPGRAVSGYSSSYGNYVDVYGICEGISYVTRYAHMPNLSFTGEKLVNTGDQIGVVDNTGNSTGNHLHYEIRGGALGSINQFLPKGVPPGCIEYIQCKVSIP